MSSIYQRAPMAGGLRPAGAGMARPAGKAGGKGGSRTIVSGARVNGTIVEWKGNYAWIQPYYPINHPDAAKKPFIFMSVSDIEQELDEMNPNVSFVVYSDGSGLGAQQVRQAGGIGCFGGYGGRAVQVQRPFMGGGAHSIYQTAYGAAPAARAGAMMMMGASPYGKACGKGGGMGAVGQRVMLTHEQVSSKVQDTLRTHLWEAIQAAELGPEETWTPEETCKRLTRYLYKAPLTEDPTTKDWNKAIKDYVEKAGNCYNRACGDRPWYETLDVTPALGAACWEIAQACDGYPRPQQKEVVSRAADLYNANIHHAKMRKFMWELIEVSFPMEEKHQEKLFKAVCNSYHHAFDDARKGKAGGFDKAERFIKGWIKDTLQRCWQGVPDAEVVFAEDAVVEFYKSAICGDETGFSAIPPMFIEAERTIEDWDTFLRTSYAEFDNEWKNPPESKAQAKARRAAEAAAEEAAA